MSRLEAGEGGRPLLLVHGFGGAKEDFADHIDALAGRGWHVVAPDLRGHGEATKPPSLDDYSFDIFVEDVVGLADDLGWGRFTLLGHSMGGMVAQVLALTYRHRLDGLILMDTSHGPLPHVDPDLIALGRQVALEEGMETLHQLTKEHAGADPLANEAHERLLRERPGYQEFCDRKFLSSSVHMWAAMIENLFAQEDRLDLLPALDMPTLVVVGELDSGMLGVSKAMADAIPGADYAVIPDAGHSPQFENPDEWWRVITAFLDRLAS
jgi:pimeloyl-ACP methyl ester carboxylesterase